MSVSLSSLLASSTEDDNIATLLDLLKAYDFPITSWGPASLPRTMIRVFAKAWTSVSAVVRNIAAGAFLSTAQGDWLTLLAKEVFDLDRFSAVIGLGQMVLTDTAGAGPYTGIVAGQLYAVGSNGKRFVNTSGGTVPLSGTLTLTWQAEEAGADSNTPTADEITLETPMPGVEVTNPAIGATGTWLTRQGVDEESDTALRQRCVDRWSSLGSGGNANAYAFHAKKASDQVARVKVYEATPSGGHVTLYVAGPSATVSTPIADGVKVYLDDGRRPLCVTTHVYPAVARPLTVHGTVTVAAAQLEAAQAYVSDQILDLQNTLGIADRVFLSEIIQRVMEAPGVTNFLPSDWAGLNNPAAPGADDVVLAANEVATFSGPVASLTWDVV